MNERDLIEQLVRDLNQAHDEIIKLQGGDPGAHDWPAWTPQANSIREAEKLLGRKLAKTDREREQPPYFWLNTAEATELRDKLSEWLKENGEDPA